MLLPMYFLIGIWGGPRREYAAIKFFLYTLFGSVFILIALLGFYFTDVQDFVHPEKIKMQKNEVLARNPSLKNDAEALDKVQIHSFDLIVLANVGRSAMDWMHL